MSALVIRAATADDAAGINAVYNPYIRETAVTFETVEFSTEDRQAWLSDRAGNSRQPILLAEQDGEVLGFASASAFDPRGAYETSVKTSVFLRPQVTGLGLGRKLYDSLFDVLAGTDVHRAYGLVAAPNPASAALHLACDFAHVSTLNEVGRKFGRYHDVMWFEKRL